MSRIIRPSRHKQRAPAPDLALAPPESVPWTPFQFSHFGPDAGAVYGNSRYTVTVRRIESEGEGVGALTWLSVHDHWRTARHDWRDLQRIKNELVGPDREAVEFYPPEQYLVDTSNEFHLWVLPKGLSLIDMGIGFRERSVMEHPQRHPDAPRAKQRPWPDDCRPTDLTDPTKLPRLSDLEQTERGERRKEHGA